MSFQKCKPSGWQWTAAILPYMLRTKFPHLSVYSHIYQQKYYFLIYVPLNDVYMNQD